MRHRLSGSGEKASLMSFARSGSMGRSPGLSWDEARITSDSSSMLYGYSRIWRSPQTMTRTLPMRPSWRSRLAASSVYCVTSATRIPDQRSPHSRIFSPRKI